MYRELLDSDGTTRRFGENNTCAIVRRQPLIISVSALDILFDLFSRVQSAALRPIGARL